MSGLASTWSQVEPSPSRWRRLVRKLNAPSRAITDPDARWRARLLAGVLLPMFLVLASGSLFGLLAGKQFPFPELSATLIVAVGYLLSRTRFAFVAALIAILGFCLPSFWIATERAALNPEGVKNAMMWLVYPAVFSGVVLPVRWAAAVEISLLSGVALFPHLVVGGASLQLSAPLAILFVTNSLVIISAAALENSRKDLRDQIRERERAETSLKQVNEQLETRVRERTAELQKTNEMLEVLVASSPAAVVMLDNDGRVLLWNPAAERIFGWTAEEVVGEQNPVVPVTQEPRGDRPFGVYVRNRINVGLDIMVTAKGGRTVEVSLSTAPLRDANGTLVGLIGVLLDLTERAMLEAELRQAQKMEAIGRLAGGVAHDFNNLLTVINGDSGQLVEELPEGHLHRELAAEILEAGNRATALTRQLLAFSRRHVAKLEIVDINAVVEGMVKLLRRLVDQNVEIKLSLSDGLSAVEADKGLMEQVLMNLVVNAGEAMAQGGRVTITTLNTRYEPTMVTGTRRSLPNAVLIAVKDTGTGMPPEVMSKVFEPFFTTKDPGKGTGLGLATVFGIISQAGGTIEVDSEPGKGTTFRSYLPAAGHASTMRPSDVAKSLPMGDETILVVEDTERVRELTSRMLRRLGYHVLAAGGGSDAIALYRREAEHIDLVLTDVVMPEMSGPECAERLREIRTDLPIVFMTGHADYAPGFEDTHRHGITLLDKPFTPDQLAGAVRKALDERFSTPPEPVRLPSAAVRLPS